MNLSGDDLCEKIYTTGHIPNVFHAFQKFSLFYFHVKLKLAQLIKVTLLLDYYIQKHTN